jgi:6-phosphogluconolactonase
MKLTDSGASVYIEESLPAVAADAAETFVRLSQEVQAMGRPFRVALSGGSTPRLLYGLLASDTFRSEVRWDGIHFFFGDERWVPHTHRDSNYKLAKDELFNKVDVNLENVFPIPTEGLSPDEAAAQYEATLREVFGTREGEVPRFDLIFLGMGPDGHTASLFPHTDVLREEEKLVAATYVEKLTSHRITLTSVVLNAAAEVVFMVVGADKAPALNEVLKGEYNPEEYPSQLLRHAQGNVTWLVDAAAASQL